MAALAFCPLSSNGRDRGCSSVGRAPQSHCGGQGFESPQLHHHRPNLRGRLKNPGNRVFRFPSAEVGWTNWKYARDLVTLLKVHLGELDGKGQLVRKGRPAAEQVANCLVEVEATGLEQAKPFRVSPAKKFMLNITPKDFQGTEVVPWTAGNPAAQSSGSRAMRPSLPTILTFLRSSYSCKRLSPRHVGQHREHLGLEAQGGVVEHLNAKHHRLAGTDQTFMVKQKRGDGLRQHFLARFPILARLCSYNRGLVLDGDRHLGFSAI
jgi:hypothetical protein